MSLLCDLLTVNQSEKSIKSVDQSEESLLCDLVRVVEDSFEYVRQPLDLLPDLLHVGRLVGDEVPEEEIESSLDRIWNYHLRWRGRMASRMVSMWCARALPES